MNTLTDFLTQAKCQFQVYDLGRKVQQINNTLFQEVARNTRPYPYPLQQHAFFAISFWQVAQQKEHFIWFLKLPLDEQGLMKITAQTSFINMVVDAMGQDLTGEVSDTIQERLASNPFIFKPSTEKLAIFSAKMNQAFVRPVSSFYAETQQYLAGEKDWQDWQHLGLQGFADVAARLDQDNNQQNIINALTHLPEQPLQTLAVCLESQEKVNKELAEQLAIEAKNRLALGKENDALMLLRSLAHCQAPEVLKALIIEQLGSPLAHSADWYISVAGRCWQQLEDETLLNRYLEALANHQQPLFAQLFADLVAIPSLRDKVLKQLRLPARSPALSQAIGLLFSGVKESTTQ